MCHNLEKNEGDQRYKRVCERRKQIMRPALR